jgi:hypothetical protein
MSGADAIVAGSLPENGVLLVAHGKPAYWQEGYLVRHPAPSIWNRAIARVVGSMESFRFRLRRRLGA